MWLAAGFSRVGLLRTMRTPAIIQRSIRTTAAVLEPSRFEGVVYDEQSKTWQSVLETNGKEIKGGSFLTEEEAAKSYDVLAQIFHGDDAVTNFETNDLASWTPHDERQRGKALQRISIRHRSVVPCTHSIG